MGKPFLINADQWNRFQIGGLAQLVNNFGGKHRFELSRHQHAFYNSPESTTTTLLQPVHFGLTGQLAGYRGGSVDSPGAGTRQPGGEK